MNLDPNAARIFRALVVAFAIVFIMYVAAEVLNLWHSRSFYPSSWLRSCSGLSGGVCLGRAVWPWF